MRDFEQSLIRIASTSVPKNAGGAIAGQVRQFGAATVRAVGPYAVNQAVKSIICARGYLLASNLDVEVQPSFVELEITGDEKTAIEFEVVRR